MKAKFIKNPVGFRGDARLYRLDEPLNNNEFVIVSGISNEFGIETFIFGADEEGEISDFTELEGSFKGDIDHERALENAGYDVE